MSQAGTDRASLPGGGEGPLVLGVRPEDVREDPEGTLELPVSALAARDRRDTALAARWRRGCPLAPWLPWGSATHIACSLGQSELHITRPGAEHPVVGERLRSTLPAERLHGFEADGADARGGATGRGAR